MPVVQGVSWQISQAYPKLNGSSSHQALRASPLGSLTKAFLSSFSFQFWSAVFGKANLGDAYRQAQSLMKKYQTGLIDVNGDGLADDLAIDGANILLGRGAVTAAFEPEIKGVADPQDIGSDSVAFLTVTGVTSVNPVDRVWAVCAATRIRGAVTRMCRF